MFYGNIVSVKLIKVKVRNDTTFSLAYTQTFLAKHTLPSLLHPT